MRHDLGLLLLPLAALATRWRRVKVVVIKDGGAELEFLGQALQVLNLVL